MLFMNYIQEVVAVTWDMTTDKTLALVNDRYYWRHMKLNVISICKRYHTYQLAKGNKENIGLSQPLSIPKAPWENISMDCVNPAKN